MSWIKKKFNLLVGSQKSDSRFVLDLKEKLEEENREKEELEKANAKNLMNSVVHQDFDKTKSIVNDLFNKFSNRLYEVGDVENHFKSFENNFNKARKKHKVFANLEELSIFDFLKLILEIFVKFLILVFNFFKRIILGLLFLFRFVYLFFGRVLFGRIVDLPHSLSSKNLDYSSLGNNSLLSSNKKIKDILEQRISLKSNKPVKKVKLKKIKKTKKIKKNRFNFNFYSFLHRFIRKDREKFSKENLIKNNFLSLNKSLKNSKSGLSKNFEIFNNKRKFENKKKKKENIFKEDNYKFKPILSFVLILFFLIIPFKLFSYYKDFDFQQFKGDVLGASKDGAKELLSASKLVSELKFEKAGFGFSRAENNFLIAQNQFQDISDVALSIIKIIPNQKIKLAAEGKNFLKIGEAVSALGNNLSLAFKDIVNYQENKNNLINIINNFLFYGGQAIVDVENIEFYINQINENAVPNEVEDQFIILKDKVYVFKQGLEELVRLLEKSKIFLGEKYDKRYLLVFQNNTEMRATGGFIGSFALVDLHKGNIKNIEVPAGGGYDTEGGMRKRIKSPEPLHLVSSRWFFWDSNWWPDWPKSAEKIMWFYEKSGGPTVDGVISFTPTVLEKILEYIGPIDMQDEYGVVIDKDNFWITVQNIVESPEAKITKKPKKIIGDLIEKILKILPEKLNQEMIFNLIDIFQETLNEKHILFYFKNKDLQEEVKKYNWGGILKTKNEYIDEELIQENKLLENLNNANWDYLSLINTNIAGGKTDKVIDEFIEHKSKVVSSGSIINTVTIKRKHNGIKNEPFTGIRNVNWVRLYVPIGSELLEAGGFRSPDKIFFRKIEENLESDPDVYLEELKTKIHAESGTKIYTEKDKTVFANWSMVDPGESAIFYFKYKLPFNIKNIKNSYYFDNIMSGSKKYPYGIFIQKQAGSINTHIKTNLDLASNFKNVWNFPDNFLEIKKNKFEVENKLNMDLYRVFLIREREFNTSILD